MYKKICSECHLPSFGSNDNNEWICPVCGENISHLKSYQEEERVVLVQPKYRSKNIYSSSNQFPKYQFNELR